jgi:ADP-ribosylglycohydrolase
MSTKLYANILGDLAGQPYEFNYKGDFSEFDLHDPRSRFTDDTIMTLATAYAIMNYGYPTRQNFEAIYKDFGERYQGDYYGAMFKEWLKSDEGTIGDSWGNGALMRVSPCFYMPEESKLTIALNSAFTSHFDVEVYEAIKQYDALDGVFFKLFQDRQIKGRYDNLEIARFEKFDSSVQASVNTMGLLVRKCNSTHNAIVTAVKLGGDTDTNACIVAEFFSKNYQDLTQKDIEYVESKLDPFLLDILREFNKYKI